MSFRELVVFYSFLNQCGNSLRFFRLLLFFFCLLYGYFSGENLILKFFLTRVLNNERGFCYWIVYIKIDRNKCYMGINKTWMSAIKLILFPNFSLTSFFWISSKFN